MVEVKHGPGIVRLEAVGLMREPIFIWDYNEAITLILKLNDAVQGAWPGKDRQGVNLDG